MIVDKAIGLLCLVVIVTITYTVFTSGKALVKMSQQPQPQVATVAPTKPAMVTKEMTVEPGKWTEWTRLDPISCIGHYRTVTQAGDTTVIDTGRDTLIAPDGVSVTVTADSMRFFLRKGGHAVVEQVPLPGHASCRSMQVATPAEKPKPQVRVSEKATNIA